jgi:hypothetical protein
MLTKIIAFIKTTFTTNIAIIIPIIASSAGIFIRTFYVNGGFKNMWSKFRLNKQKASAEREEERRVIIIKEITQIEQIINLIQKEKKNEKDEELKEKLESKIHELEKRKKELLLKL